MPPDELADAVALTTPRLEALVRCTSTLPLITSRIVPPDPARIWPPLATVKAFALIVASLAPNCSVPFDAIVSGWLKSMFEQSPFGGPIVTLVAIVHIAG